MTTRINDRHIAALHSLTDALDELQIKVVLIGGVAVSFLAEPRFTRDVDALIIFDMAHLTVLLDVLERHELLPLFDGVVEFAQESHVIPLKHTPTDIIVDLMLGCMPFDSEVIERARPSGSGEISIFLPTPEDLVILKAIASRPKDLEDIRNIALTYPRMDRKRIEHWVRQYGELLESPELWEQTRALLDE